MTATQLAYLNELVARDEASSAELSELDRQLAAVAELRARAEWARLELELGPSEIERVATAAAGARERVTEARERLEQAVRDQTAVSDADSAELRHAERLVTEARDTVHIAERLANDAGAALQARRAQLEQAETELPQIERRVAELAGAMAVPRLPARVAVPPTGLAQICEWAVEARAALVVARSAVASEREQTIRQAGELGALVTGRVVPASSMATLAGVVRSALAR